MKDKLDDLILKLDSFDGTIILINKEAHNELKIKPFVGLTRVGGTLFYKNLKIKAGHKIKKGETRISLSYKF